MGLVADAHIISCRIHQGKAADPMECLMERAGIVVTDVDAKTLIERSSPLYDVVTATVRVQSLVHVARDALRILADPSQRPSSPDASATMTEVRAKLEAILDLVGSPTLRHLEALHKVGLKACNLYQRLPDGTAAAAHFEKLSRLLEGFTGVVTSGIEGSARWDEGDYDDNRMAGVVWAWQMAEAAKVEAEASMCKVEEHEKLEAEVLQLKAENEVLRRREAALQLAMDKMALRSNYDDSHEHTTHISALRAVSGEAHAEAAKMTEMYRDASRRARDATVALAAATSSGGKKPSGGKKRKQLGDSTPSVPVTPSGGSTRL